MTLTQTDLANGPGRPVGSDGDKVRNALLQAARELFMRNEFKAVTVRRVADGAGVNPAMVNYYFGSKQGLYLGMVEAVLAELETRAAQLDQGAENDIGSFMQSYSLLLAENPWWPNFVIREVLFGEADTRELVIKKFAGQLAPLLLASAQEGVASGQYHADLDPRFTLVSIMGMTLFPFIAKPLLQQVLNLDYSEEMVRELVTHNTKILYDGIKISRAGADL